MSLSDDERALIERGMAGDERAAVEVAQQFEPYINVVCRRALAGSGLTGFLLDDVVLEVMFIVCRKLHQLRSPDALWSWLNTAARRTAQEFVYRRPNTRPDPRAVSWDALGDQEGRLDDYPSDSLAEQFRETLKRIPPEDLKKKIPPNYLNALLLKVEHGYSYAEIAKILNVKEASVGSMVHRAKRAVERLLEGMAD